jgi:hypothetical protein
MTKDEIIAKVKVLNLPKDSYVVFGSGPMAVVGLREAKDIDMLVSTDVLLALKKSGWQTLDKGPKDQPAVFDVFEAHDNWDFSSYNPTLVQLLATATIVEGIPFASLLEVKKWKAAASTPKNQADIALIDAYLGEK